MKRSICALTTALVFAAAFSASAARLHDIPVTLHQPDGTPVPAFVSGDEYFRWAHDARGYVITESPGDGRLVYAASRDGLWVPTEWTVGSVDPGAKGLDPQMPVPISEVRRRIEFFRNHTSPDRPVVSGMAKTGQFNNIVVFVRFSDQTEFPEYVSHYDDMFNNATPGQNSMMNYYQEVSYGQLSVTTSFFPQSSTLVLSYQDPHQRSYFSPRSYTNPAGYDTANSGLQGAQRLHTMLQAAVNLIRGQVPAALDIDRDDDGYVDNVCFIARGTSDTWNDWLWPHMWQLMAGYGTTINGKQVSTYNFQLADILNRAEVGTGVLCHEMFHSLGAPDLYRYQEGNGTFFPVGGWDLMEDNRNPPQHMTSYMKYRYGGWISSLPVISASGTYSLNPVTSSSNNCYRINSPNTADEYFVVEYRSQASSGFEAQVPGSGLIVYRINTAADGNGNAQGPPDEVYVYCPNGTNTETGLKDSAFFSAAVGRTSITDQTNPSAFLSDGRPGGLQITGIGAAAATISFTVTVDGGTATCATEPGDANGFGGVNIHDLVATVNDILQTHPLDAAGRACADMAAPAGTIDLFDLLAIVDRILHPGALRPAPTADPDGAPVPPLTVRTEQESGAWRLTFDGSRVAGMQLELPVEAWPSPVPRLEGGAPGVNLDWDVQAGKLRLLVYASNGGGLASGECALVLPASPSWSGAPRDAAADQGATPVVASYLPPGSTLCFASAQGRPLPFILAADERANDPRAARVLTLEPNPTRGEVRFRVAGLLPGAVSRVRACDAAGRFVATCTSLAAAEDGTAAGAWDGRDSNGAPLPAGVYFLAPEGGIRGGATKLLIVR